MKSIRKGQIREFYLMDYPVLAVAVTQLLQSKTHKKLD